MKCILSTSFLVLLALSSGKDVGVEAASRMRALKGAAAPSEAPVETTEAPVETIVETPVDAPVMGGKGGKMGGGGALPAEAGPEPPLFSTGNLPLEAETEAPLVPEVPTATTEEGGRGKKSKSGAVEAEAAPEEVVPETEVVPDATGSSKGEPPKGPKPGPPAPSDPEALEDGTVSQLSGLRFNKKDQTNCPEGDTSCQSSIPAVIFLLASILAIVIACVFLMWRCCLSAKRAEAQQPAEVATTVKPTAAATRNGGDVADDATTSSDVASTTK